MKECDPGTWGTVSVLASINGIGQESYNPISEQCKVKSPFHTY